jgi:large subunit ribosomal protein L13
MKTIFVKPASVDRKWYVIDANDKILGKVAAKAANVLRGKVRPFYTPHQEVGDFVIIVNADKVRVTGGKEKKKIYYRHSGYPGGMTSETLGKVIARKPTFPIEHALMGMLPHGSLGRKLFTNAKIYAGPEHPHAAQKPETLEIGD